MEDISTGGAEWSIPYLIPEDCWSMTKYKIFQFLIFIFLEINCTDPKQNRTDVDTVDWNGSLQYQTQVIIKCSQFGKNFYEIISGVWQWYTTQTLTCGADKKWSPDILECKWRYCFDPPTPSNGSLLTRVTAYDSSNPPAHYEYIHYNCSSTQIAADVPHWNRLKDNFEFDYVNVNCLEENTWSLTEADLPNCVSSNIKM